MSARGWHWGQFGIVLEGHDWRCAGQLIPMAGENGAPDDETAADWAVLWLSDGTVDCYCQGGAR